MKRERFIVGAGLSLGLVMGCSDSKNEVAAGTGDTAVGTTDTSGGDSDAAGGADSSASDDTAVAPETITVSADITTDTVWKSGNTYILDTHIFVEGATLTIEPGVLVKGETGSSIVITTSARLDAQGTATAPIVFTSNQPEGQRAAGDWGGIVLLGSAPINVEGGSESIEGFPAGSDKTVYGGTDATHACGTLKYARIEFAGFELEKDNELNGLTVAGCGTGTQIDYVQVHLGADDGIEMFGGTASLRHIVITQPDDDGLDWDFGWTGTVQFLVLQQNGLVGDNGIEADNNKNANDAAPRSAPSIWNTTWVGSNSEPATAGKTQTAFLFRRGTGGVLRNAVVAHFTDFGIQVNDASTVALMDDATLAVQDSLWWDNGGKTDVLVGKSDVAGTDPAALMTAAANHNQFADPQLVDALNLDAPNFLPKAGSPALTGGATPPAGFDATATYFGAFKDVDWTAGWTDFPAN